MWLQQPPLSPLMNVLWGTGYRTIFRWKLWVLQTSPLYKWLDLRCSIRQLMYSNEISQDGWLIDNQMNRRKTGQWIRLLGCSGQKPYATDNNHRMPNYSWTSTLIRPSTFMYLNHSLCPFKCSAVGLFCVWPSKCTKFKPRKFTHAQ